MFVFACSSDEWMEVINSIGDGCGNIVYYWCKDNQNNEGAVYLSEIGAICQH